MRRNPRLLMEMLPKEEPETKSVSTVKFKVKNSIEEA